MDGHDAAPRRHAHRKRISVARLSSDTLTLPVPDIRSKPWSRSAPSLIHPDSDPDTDLPPQYPDSADEADEETDDVRDIPYSPPPTAKRHLRRHSSQNTRRAVDASSSDPYLDALLARSVQALEMSNVLLQSSAATQSSLSAVLLQDSMADRTLEARARGLGSRIRRTDDTHANWMEDLEEITRGVEGLFPEDQRRRPIHRPGRKVASDADVPISQSLPTSAYVPPPARTRRRPSLDVQPPDNHLQMIDADRIPYVSPPRALTQYVSVEAPMGDASEITADPSSILLPSTIGLRAPSSVSRFSSSRSVSSAPPHTRTFTAPLRTPEPRSPTPAYNLLSSFSPPPKPRMSRSSSVASSSRQSLMDTLMDFGRTRSRSPSAYSSPDRTVRQRSTSRSRSVTPSQSHPSPTLPRPMTPTLEESTPSDDTSSADEHPRAKLTMESLKKILEDQPPPAPPTADKGKGRADAQRRAPVFLPRTAAAATTQASTTTTSISRLFTKGRHSSSTRAPSPPPHSSMKGRPRRAMPPPLSVSTFTGAAAPGSEPSTAGIASAIGSAATSASASARASRPSSGTTTPRRISFAQLPESYTQSRGGSEGSLRLREKEKKRKKARAAAAKASARGEKDGGDGWWSSWFFPAHGVGGSSEERAEEKFARGWGMRGASVGGMDEWGV